MSGYLGRASSVDRENPAGGGDLSLGDGLPPSRLPYPAFLSSSSANLTRFGFLLFCRGTIASDGFRMDFGALAWLGISAFVGFEIGF